MDPNIVKFFEEDEDETMHSGADVEAMTAELNRDIEAAISQGSRKTECQFLPQWQTSNHNEIGVFQNLQDSMFTEQKEQHSSHLELQKLGSNSENLKQENVSSYEFNSLALPCNPSPYVCRELDDNYNSFPVSQSMGMQTYREQPIHIQEPASKLNPGRELQLHKLDDMSNQQSIEMRSSNQQPMAMELNDQKPWSTGKGSLKRTSMGLNNEQAMVMANQHAIGMGMSNQQAVTSGISNQQSMTSSNQQPGTMSNFDARVSFGMLIQIIQSLLDKDRAMQKNEISKDVFDRHLRSIVGDQLLKSAAYKLQIQAARSSKTASSQFQSQSQASAGQMQVSSTGNSNTVKSHEVQNEADSQGVQTSFTTYGSAGRSHLSSSAANAASSTSLQLQPCDSHMRQTPAHQSMTVSLLGPTTQSMNATKMSSDPRKMQVGSLTHRNSNTALQQNPEWPLSTNKELIICVSSSMTYVKQESVDQSNEQQYEAQMSSAQRLSSSCCAHIKQDNAAPGKLKDESFTMQSSRMGFTPPASMVPSNSLFSSTPRLMETSTLPKARMPSLTSASGPGNSSKAPLKISLVGQMKPMEEPASLLPPSCKKQKVSEDFLDQSIEQLNDVTAVSGVNLREEEEHLFSGPKEDSLVLEAYQQVVQEEEKRLIFYKIPLQKKMAEKMAKCGLKSMSNDVERCLSLCVEERMRGLISNLIRLSKQHVDVEKPRHRTIITSDVRQQIMTINRKAHEELEKKQAETEETQKLNEPESATGVNCDKEKNESRVRSAKANKEEDDKMRTKATNIAVRAATGVGDMLLKWQSMIEAKQKQEGIDSKDEQKHLPRNTRENQEAEKQEHSSAFDAPAFVRKVGRNQVMVSRRITVKDVIAMLEKEPQMSKSTLIYRLYDKFLLLTA